MIPGVTRFCPFRASNGLNYITQGVASLALGYALVGLSARQQQEQQAAWDWIREDWDWLDKTVGGDMEFATFITVTLEKEDGEKFTILYENIAKAKFLL